jgi:ATP-dependent RNA helicase DeaD
MTIRGNESRFRLMTDESPTGPAPGTRPRASREDRRSFHRSEGRKDFGDRHGKKFGDDKPFENRKARREKMFGDKKFHKDHDERSFGDKPFRKTRRFGRV